VTGRLSATSQKGSITLPNYIVNGSTTPALFAAVNLSAPEGKLNLYTGTTKTALSLVDIKLNARDGIALSPTSLTATGPGGIWINGPLTLAADTTLTASDANAPISVGGMQGGTAGGQSLTINAAGGPVTILSGIGQATSLKNFNVDKTSNLTVNGSVKADGFIFLKVDGVALQSPITSPTITVQNLTAGKTLTLGTNTGADIALDSSEVANLIGGQINLGKTDSGLITIGGTAAFNAGTGKVQIVAPAGIATLNGGGVSVDTLAISASIAGKDVILSGANSVKNLAGQFANDLLFSNLGGLNLGAGPTAFTVGKNATLSTTGPITQGAAVSVAGLLGLTATAGLGQEQDITLTNPANSMPAVNLGYAGDVKLATAGDLKLSQKTVTEGSATVPALVGSLDATSGSANRISFGSNLDISGPIKLVSGTAIPLSTDTQIRSTVQSGDAIFIKGTIADANGKNLVLDAGGGSLVVDGISLSGGTSALTIPSLGGISSIGILKTGPVTVQNGAGTLNLNSPETNSLSITAGTLAVTISSLAKVGALSAYNTELTTLGGTGTVVTMPAGAVVNKLATATVVTTLSFLGGGTLLSPFTVTKGLTLTAGDASSDSLIIPGGLIIASGGNLNGSGILQGNVTVQSGAIYAPTDHTITGNLDLLGTLQVPGNTTSVANGPLTVNGIATITGAKLEVVNAGGVKPAKGAVILAIENGPNGQVNGTFAGQDNGSNLQSSTGLYVVTYANGDVVLTAAEEQIKRGIYGVAVMGGATGKSHLDIFTNGTDQYIRSVDAFPGFRGEFYVDSGDITGDGIEDIIVGSGNGSMNGHVVLFDGARLLDPTSTDTAWTPNGKGTVLASLYAFINYSSGVAVRLAEVTGDGIDDIVLAPGTGAGTTTQSHLRVWDGKLSMDQFRAGAPFSSYDYAKWELASFYAFGGDGAPGGGMAISVVRKQGGDQIVASQLFGGGMRVFEYNTQTRSKVLTIVADLSGTLIATGNTVVGLNSPGGDRFYVTAGTAASNSDTLYLRNKDGGVIGTQTNVFAGAKGGMRVSVQNLDGDSQDELLVIRDSTAEVAVFDILFSGSTFTLGRKGSLSRGGAGGWV
ncbi:MAG: beta strand repeat-containing protein, partial [Gemmataceae bacterium]